MRNEMDSTQKDHLRKSNDDRRLGSMETSKNEKAKEAFNRKPYYLEEPEYYPELDD